LKNRIKYDKKDNKNRILFERVIVAQMQGGRFRPDHRRTVVRRGLGEADNAADDRKTRSKPKNMTKKTTLKPIKPEMSLLKAILKPKVERKYASKPNFNPNEPIKPFVDNFQVAHLPREARRGGFVAGFFNRQSKIDNHQSPEQTQFFHDQNLDIASKTQKWRPKNDPKKRNKPICG
jgi:hypothetical protein